MTEFVAFINYSWPWFVAGLIIRVICWQIGGFCSWLNVGLGDINSKD